MFTLLYFLIVVEILIIQYSENVQPKIWQWDENFFFIFNRALYFLVFFVANDGKVSSAKLDELYKKLGEIENTSKEIQNLTNVAKNVILEAEVNVTNAEQLIAQAKQTLMVFSMNSDNLMTWCGYEQLK